MKRDDEIRILKEMLEQLDEKKSVDAGRQLKNPTSAYTDRERAQREWKTLFQEHPQFIGLSGDLPTNGSFFTTSDFGVPVLATRDDAGRFRGFVNACRHRGVRIAHEPRGEARHFTCPFHNWTYSSAGALKALPRERDFGTVDRETHGLIELPADERYGMLWVHPQPHGKLDVDAMLGDLAPELESWHAGDQCYMGETVLDKRLNWKLANDTFGETYHFERLHRRTLGNLFYGDALSYQVFGRNHRFVFPSRRIDRLRGVPEKDWKFHGIANVLYFIFPNVQFNVGKHQTALFRIYPHPEDPGRSITRTSHYFSKKVASALEDASRTEISSEDTYNLEARQQGGVLLGLEATREVFDSTLEQEDYAMGESTQRAAESGSLPHVLFGRNEPALHHFHNTFHAALGEEPLEEVAD